MNLHPPIQFVAGDDWEIVATLLDENGNPYDLTGTHTIKWRLVANSNGFAVIGDEAVITLPDALHGVCSVLIPASVSTVVVGGHYTDALRLVMSGETGTLLMGQVNVISDPWASPQRQVSIERKKLELIEPPRLLTAGDRHERNGHTNLPQVGASAGLASRQSV